MKFHMLLSVAAGALPLYPLRTTLHLARRAGADGVELMLGRRLLHRTAEEIQHVAGEAGTCILSAHAFLSFREKSIRQKIERDTASIRLAGALPSCESIVLHPPLTGPRVSSDFNRWLNAISEERERVRPSLTLALENRVENFDGVEPQWVDDLTRLRSLAGEWGMHICLDIAHAASFEIDVRDAIEAVLPRLANVHLSDTHDRRFRNGVMNGLFRDHAVPGTGRLPIENVIHLLDRRGYRGPLTIELNPLSLQAYLPGAPCRILRSTVSDLREHLMPQDNLSQRHRQPRRQPF